MDVVKESKIDALSEFRLDNLAKNRALVEFYQERYLGDISENIDLMNGEIEVSFCESSEEKKRWKAYVLMTSSFPWKGAVGRQVKMFVNCNGTPVGMVHLTSPMAQMRVRDACLNFSDKWAELQQYYNMEVCIPLPRYAHLLTGKLLVYSIFSQEVYGYLKNRYTTDVRGFETTSLYGKSSMYNRIPFFKYLGLTDGLSAVYIKDEEWQEILLDYKSKFPKFGKNRLAPVKFQIVDKLNKWYQSRGIEFPYKYQDVSFRRGVYLGMTKDHNVSLSDSVSEWRERWLIGRMERHEN
jgi:hypothetical protein